MVRVLHVNSSPRSSNSQSLTVANEFLATFQKAHPDASVDTWDLFADPLPAFGVHAAEAKMATFFGQEQSAEQQTAWESARSVFERVQQADFYLFNIPMWNHGLPYVLKQWIDIITQPGWAFGFDPATGYSGLLNNKRAVCVYTSGVYADGRPPAFGTDFLTSYFGDWLNFVGVTDVAEIKLLGQVLNPDPAAAAELAVKQARELATQV
ncbi:FMN-dependent NADH-azoreductase [Jongsikchunia kroppenstedtii]|uniref:FMN-dependent NADH-azoreductase n=1 Tax=Jongsikchunia kroppenstedtii TaxID=1121721 RepID=UPI000475C459|nr:NAD(P)H-dependent oxidoreductase [Jongsikchunia kroppenstedtii]